ncbi:MAG: hypothetical protein K2O10_01880 [Muribaculaceae bacterium]|nr:hypothetical protein [Muribaculaceae bacterium]
MKKSSILAMALLTAGSALAQQQLVKEVEREMKSKPESYPDLIEKLKPAFTNEETAKDAHTWITAGKGATGYFDNQQVKIQLGDNNVDKKAVGHALLDGVGYLTTVFTVDTVVDAKGKIKTKYSKEAANQLRDHYNDLTNAAVYLWDKEDYDGAVKAWQLYVDARTNPIFKDKVKTIPDSIYGEIYYNMGIGNSLTQNHESALQAFKNAISNGYTKKNAFDYGISAAAQLKNSAEMAALAEMAYPLYGAEDARYIGYIVNNYIEQKQFQEASDMLDQYLQADPDNSQLYYIKGVLADAMGNQDMLMQSYRKAIELDPKNSQALLQLGYQICKQADAIDEAEGGGLSNEDYKALRTNKIDPLYREAAGLLEQAYAENNDLDDARRLLRGIYYKLNDEENLKRVEAM